MYAFFWIWFWEHSLYLNVYYLRLPPALFFFFKATIREYYTKADNSILKKSLFAKIFISVGIILFYSFKTCVRLHPILLFNKKQAIIY